MTDSGDIYLSLTKVLRSADSWNFKIAMHELGHIYLSQMEGYDGLLMLDRDFLGSYPEKENAKTLSPIEVYATLVGCAFLGAAAENADESFCKVIRTLISEELSKITKIIKNAPISEQ